MNKNPHLWMDATESLIVMLSKILYSIRSISLRWKLLLPLLLFSFFGTATLVYISFTSQEELIKKEERKEVQGLYGIFLAAIDYEKDQALSLATVFAENQNVKQLVAMRDRRSLTDLLLPVYHRLKRDFGVMQLHFHVPPGNSFLRLHLLNEFGESVAYRKTVMEAIEKGRGAAGLERGLAGLGIRGVAPIFHEGELVGSVEIGYPFGRQLLDVLKTRWGPELTVYEKTGKGGGCVLLATTLGEDIECSPIHPLADSVIENPIMLIAPDKCPHKSILLGPIRDYEGKMVGVVEIAVDRWAIEEQLSRARALTALVGVAGVFISFFLIWMVAALFIRPIREIVREAQEIAEGKRETHLDPRPYDEIGVATHTLNVMLDSLRDRRLQIEYYASTLERKVQQRTADLVVSEEKYRNLVDNLPLIVYRLLDDGTTEFVNHYFTGKLGYSVEEAVSDKSFWQEKICGSSDDQNKGTLATCWADKEDFHCERVVRDKQGRLLTFIDQAIPSKDDKGRVKWIDGIMVDITQQKELQERAIRAEEVRILGEISARFAHEMRNPLATAGGFARRLCKSIPQGHQNREFAQICVEEVAKLEDILDIILSSIEPFTLCISEVDLNNLLRTWLKDLEDQMEAKGISLVESLSPSIPNIQGDELLLNRAFENLLKYVVLSIPNEEEFFISTSKKDDNIIIKIRYRAKGLAEEDLEQFFLPRLTYKAESTILDLPLSKIIIHRHGGKVDVSRENRDIIVIRIELPVKSSVSLAENGG